MDTSTMWSSPTMTRCLALLTAVLYLGQLAMSAEIAEAIQPDPTLPPPLPWDCTFEAGNLCSWSQGTNDDFDWTLQTGSTPTAGTGPPADHTTQTKDGYYVVINVSSVKESETAVLYSENVTTDTDMCITFWYHMYGPHVDALIVGYADPSGNPDLQEIWTRSGEQSYDWQFARVPIKTSVATPKIYFEGVAGSSYQGDIAIDDIIFTMGACPELLFCDFENPDACGYANDDTNDFDWSRSRGLTEFDGPFVDHTTGTLNGYFMKVNIGVVPREGQTGRLTSPAYPRPISGYRCAEFWYSISGNAGYFTATAYNTNDSAVLTPTGISANFSDSTDYFWMKHFLEVPSSSQNIFTFDFLLTSDLTYGYVAIDDVFVKDSPCTGQIGTCDFEVDTCDWANTQGGDEIDWLRHSGSTGTEGTGPTFDHTTGTPSGWYMYIDSALGTTGVRARLESSVSDPPQFGDPVCFSLWYHMTSYQNNQSNILSVVWESARRTGAIWSFKGSQPDEWIKQEMTFHIDEPYRIMIEGVLASNESACDIAIDDTYLMNGEWCNGTGGTLPPFQCASGGQLVAAQHVCDMVADCQDGSDEIKCGTCSFDTDQCGYYSDPNGLLPWLLQGTGVPTTPPPGLFLPPDDGTYMMVDNTATPVGEADYARLVGPWVQRAATLCTMEFWYYLAGEDDIKVSYKTSPVEETIMYRAAVPFTGSWQLGTFSVGSIRNPFQFNFLGDPNLGVSGGVIAVGDIQLLGCAAFPAPQPACLDVDFTCSNRACVTADKVCDFNDDCGDFSDELQCDTSIYVAQCDFESNMCSYTHADSDFPWVRTSGAQVPDKDFAPTRDHTTNNAGGSYMLADFLGKSKGDVARFASPIFQATGIVTACTVRFHYFGHGTDPIKINIYIRTMIGGPMTLVSSITNFDLDSFMSTEQYLVSMDDFDVIFEAQVRDGSNAAVAFDDISFFGCDLTDNPLPAGTTVPPPTTLEPCPNPGDFQCGDGLQCVPQEQVCDLTIQCDTEEDESFCGACEFDTEDLCGSDSFGWEWVEAGSNGSYIPTDHFDNPINPGFYMQGTRGIHNLITPEIGPTGGLCEVEFYFYFSNATQELSLNVYISGGPSIFFVRGNMDIVTPMTWLNVSVKVGEYAQRIQLAFDHVFSNPNEEYYIGLDGISYNNCPGFPTPVPTTLPSLPPPLPWDCTFEGGDLCTWSQSSNDDFDWTIQNGSSLTAGTGPPADHTTQTKEGYYIVIDSSSANPTEVAVIYSDDITTDTDMCLMFWYHMYGPHVGTLSVGYADPDGEPAFQDLWTRFGEQSYDWLFARVPITTTTQYPKIFFQGMAGNGYQGDIALDDISTTMGACPELLFCDFEDVQICGYTNDDANDLDWTRRRGTSEQLSGGPYVDHTTGTDNGYFMKVDISGFSPGVGDRGRLSTSAYPRPYSGYRCAEFWYSISDYAGEFIVTAYNTNDTGVLTPTGISANFSVPTNNYWRQHSLEVRSGAPNVFTFDFIITDVITQAFVAIDDVFVKDNYCIGQIGTCDFEVDKCDWTNPRDVDEIDWLRHSGSTGTAGTGPDFDHTIGTPSGWYMYIDSALGATGVRARLESSFTDPPANSDPTCYSLWYHMTSATTSDNTLSIAWESATRTNVIWSFTGSKSNEWTHLQVTFYVNEPYRIVIEGILASNDSGCDIAIDDTYLMNGEVCDGSGTPPPPFPCSSGGQTVGPSQVCDMVADCADGSDELNCGSCAFDVDQMCGYYSDPNGLYPWIYQGSGASPDPPPGLILPPADGRKYMVVDNTAVPMDGADYARFVGPWVQRAASSCSMQFWYYLEGGDDIRVSYKTSPAEETILYRAAVPGSWEYGYFDVGSIRNPFQFNFIGDHNPSVSGGVIAVSSITMSSCNNYPEPEPACAGIDFTCSNRACVGMDEVCDFNDDCGDYSDEMQCDPAEYPGRCDFDSDMCSYTHADSDFPWVRTSGAQVPDKEFAPTRDHTTNNAGGSYMLAEYLGRDNGDVARFVSPTFEATGIVSLCEVRFHYFGHGTDQVYLNVYTRSSIGGPMDLVKSYTNFAADSFMYADELLTVMNDFQVVFEAEVQQGPNAAVAIDDISFVGCDLANGELPVGTTTPAPTTMEPCPIPGEFQCGDGQCVPQDQVCDFITQCSNEMDELYCGACEFDSEDLCGSENFGWVWTEAGSEPGNIPTDHYNNPESPGYYLHGDFGMHSLLTPEIGPTGSLCKVEFYYYMSNATRQLSLMVAVDGGETLLIISGDDSAVTPGVWEYAVAEIGEYAYPIQLNFAHIYWFLTENYFIGLDGISYLHCPVGYTTLAPPSTTPPTTSTQPMTTAPITTTEQPTTTTKQPTTTTQAPTTTTLPPTTTTPPATTTPKQPTTTPQLTTPTPKQTEPPTDRRPTTEEQITEAPSSGVSEALIISLSVVGGIIVVFLIGVIIYNRRKSKSTSGGSGTLVENPMYSAEIQDASSAGVEFADMSTT